MFKMIATKVVALFILLFLDYSDCINVCGDWIQYKDIKCIKILAMKGTEEEALKTCAKLDQNSVLMTIHSEEEQEYLNSLLENYHNISLNVWLGMKYTENAFKWMDGTNTDFNNWSDDAGRDGSAQCVEMSLQKETLGKWHDVSCKRTALIFCQKKQVLSLMILKNALENITQVYEDTFSSLYDKFEHMTKIYEEKLNYQENKIKMLEQTSIPIGILYTQLPNQSSPEELWPNTKWTDITPQYSGLFFRAEGEDSLPFGETQQANQSYISDVRYNGCYFDSWSGIHCDADLITPLKQENWTDVAPGYRYPRFLQFYTTKGEVRPKNTAIRIFKRIQ